MLEPTYLRFVFDKLSSGSINADNPSNLPNGFTGIFENQFQDKINILKKKEEIEKLTYWAILNDYTSISIVSKIYGCDILEMNELILKYSSWFNKSSNGELKLFHDRLKLYLLSKSNDLQIENIIKVIIGFCENVLRNLTNSNSEFISFSLKNYVRFLKIGLVNNPDYYQKIKSYCFNKDIIDSYYNYLSSLNYFIYSINVLLEKSIELNKQNDFFEIIDKRIEIRNYLNQKIKHIISHELNSFSSAYFNLGLEKNLFFYKQYFLVAFCKLSQLIKENRISQADIDIVFNKLDLSEYKKHFNDLTEITSGNFWKKLIDLLNEKSIDCTVILNHLPDDFLTNTDKYFNQNYYTVNIEKSYNSLVKSNIKNFIIENLNRNIDSDCYSEYFSLIDNPLYFQDKLIELYEYASFKSNYKILIEAIHITSSSVHLSELVSILINVSLEIQDEDLQNLYNSISNINLKVEYFKVTDRLKILFDSFLKSNDRGSISRILLSLDRNSFEYYIDYCSDYYFNKNDFSAIENLLVLTKHFIHDKNEINNSIIVKKLKYKSEQVILLNSINQDDALNKINSIKDDQLVLQKIFFKEIGIDRNKKINEFLINFFSNRQVLNQIKNFKNHEYYKNLNLTNNEIKALLLKTAELRIQKIITDSLKLRKENDLRLEKVASGDYVINEKDISPIKNEHLFSLNQKIIKILIPKLEYNLNKSDKLCCLYALTHLNYFESISKYLNEILIYEGFDHEELNFFQSKPSIKTLFEFMKGYGIKDQLYGFLNEETFLDYNTILLQTIHSPKILNPIQYLNDLQKINEEDLNEMYYELGLKLNLKNLKRELLQLIDSKYLKDFIRGIIGNSISNSVEMNLLFKTLLFNFSSIEEIQNILIDELIIYERLFMKNTFADKKNISTRLENIYITKILKSL